MSTRSRGTVAGAWSIVNWKSRKGSLSSCDTNTRWGDGELETIIVEER